MAAAAAMAAMPAISLSIPTQTLTKNQINKNNIIKPFQGFSNVVQQLNKDRNFLQKHFSHFFWLRNFEQSKPAAAMPAAQFQSPFPYPQGLSGFDLLMADIEAVKVYASYFKQKTNVLTMPLPETYDSEKVELYFSCRPHVLAIRIIEVLLSFASVAIKMQYSGRFDFIGQQINSEDNSDYRQYQIGQLVKESLLNLGPTFVKVGQSLSTRPDIIGSEMSKALSELHDKVPPFPREVAMKIIEEELGCSKEDIFSHISEEPVAAASFGQVYYGLTLDGSAVAIKVQRPNLLHAVVRDIWILRLGLSILRKVAKRKNDIRLYADELGKGFVGELDYTNEAANADKFMAAHSRYSFILVPKVFPKLTRKRVLTMEWVNGENPKDLLLLSKASGQDGTQLLERRNLEAKVCLLDLVSKGIEASLIQLLETGLLHADPHPGNLRYTPEGNIGFLDFGLLCQMEKKHQLAMLSAIIHIVNGAWKDLVYDLVQMDVIMKGTNILNVTMELEDALGEVNWVNGVPDISFSRVLGKILSVALKYQFRMPPYFILVLRSLASLEGLAIAADPNFKTFQAAYPFVARKLLYDNSVVSRKLLYSVVFDKRRKIQWGQISLFLKLGSQRRSSTNASMSLVDRSENVPDKISHNTQLILKLLTSSDGVVLRRIIMTADGVSLAQAFTSNDAAFLRQDLTLAAADLICQWILKADRRRKEFSQFNQIALANGHKMEFGLLSSPPVPVFSFLRDRRIKVIFYKVLSDVRRDPILMFKVCWSFFAMSMMAASLALHRLLVLWSEAHLTSNVGRLKFASVN